MKGKKSLLAAVLGANKTQFCVFDAFVAPQLLTEKQKLSLITREYPSFAELINAATHRLGASFDGIAIAVPAPILHLPIACQGIPWTIDPREARYLGPTMLINTDAAQGWATTMPAVQNLRYVCGPPLPTAGDAGIMAVLDCGTHMGCSVTLHRNRKKPVVVPSAFGLSLLPIPLDDYALGQFLKKRHIRPDAEHLLTWNGISALCAFATGKELCGTTAARTMPEEMWRTLSSYYGICCQNLILSSMPAKGLLLAGEIVNSYPRIVTNPAFTQALYDFPGEAEMIHAVRISIVQNEDAVLWGAAICALHQIKEEEPQS